MTIKLDFVPPDSHGWRPMPPDISTDQLILVFIPILKTAITSPTKRSPYEHSIAWWREDVGRWDGEWRYFLDAPEVAAAVPTHWKPLDVPNAYKLEQQVLQIIQPNDT